MLPLHRLRLETMYTVSRKDDVVCVLGQGQFEFILLINIPSVSDLMSLIAALIIGSFIVCCLQC